MMPTANAMDVTTMSPIKTVSDIPRASKLPVGRQRLSQLPTPSLNTKLPRSITPVEPPAPSPSKNLPRLQNRASIASLSHLPPASSSKGPTSSKPGTFPKQPSLSRPQVAKSSASITAPKSLSKPLAKPYRSQAGSSLVPPSRLNIDKPLGGTVRSQASRSGSRHSASDTHDSRGLDLDIAVNTKSDPRNREASRPSLSDRTIESLQSLPSTPRDRKTSDFFGGVNSPASAISSSARSVSSVRRDVRGISGPSTNDVVSVDLDCDVPSPTKRLSSIARPNTSKALGGFGFTPTARRTISVASSRDSLADERLATGAGSAGFNRLSQRSPVVQSDPVPRTTLRGRSSRQQLKVDAKAVRSITKSPLPVSDNEKTPRPSAQEDFVKEQPTASKQSSVALREQIAAAKAAARAARATQRHDSHHDTNSDGANDNKFPIQPSPFGKPVIDEKQMLRAKIDKARMDGSLNLSGLELFEIPNEVMTMYDPAEMAAANITWSEATELTRLVAADNQFESLDDRAFPDQSTEDLSEADNMQSCQFRGLTYLDLHGNALNKIPKGLRWLERLTTLDLARNKLENSAAETICGIKALRHLNLSHNQFAGSLPASFCQLHHLEYFVIHDNRLLSLPEAFQNMSNLKTLNVANNQLTMLPMEAFQHLALRELDASNNALIASLFPLGSISCHRTLHTLNVANNSLAALAFSELLDLPELRSLNVSNNHLTNMPPINGWTELHTLLASENKLAEIPTGFTALHKLRTADFTGNGIKLIDPDIGRMDCLESFSLAANPLREKKFLTMTTADIRRDLKSRLEPDDVSVDSRDDDVWADAVEHGSRPATAMSETAWVLSSNGALDLKSKGLSLDVNDRLGLFFQNRAVRNMVLQSNSLSAFPTCLNLATSLSVLDLSRNPFASEYLIAEVSLPALTQLSLASCRLNDLSLLESRLRAPTLQSLDVTANRLTGALPVLRDSFPSLTALFASDNRFSSLTAQSLRGLQVANVSSNDIERLPPEVGLLWDEGLRSFEVGSNIFRMPNYQILQKGTEATLRWLRNHLPAQVSEMER